MFTVHLHYVKSDSRSVEAAQRASQSFKEYQWTVRLVEGYTKEDVDPTYLILPNGRLYHILENDPQFFRTKLAILQNHIRFWEMTAASNEPQIYAEHDAVCYNYAPDMIFEDILVLHENEFDDRAPTYEYPTKYEGATLINGATCYALTPKGARKLLAEVEEGVDQGDMMINSYVVNIQRLNNPVVKTEATTHSLGSGYDQ